MSDQILINGVDVQELGNKAKALAQDPELAKFQFRAENRWLDTGHNRTTVKDFHGVGQEISRAEPFALDADEPPVLLGGDCAANPVEHLLHALVSCLTTSLVYHAALRGIKIDEVESTMEGDLDVRGFMGLSGEVRKGYQNIKVTFRVKADAPKETLEELARYSPVLDVVTNGTPVSLQVETVQTVNT